MTLTQEEKLNLWKLIESPVQANRDLAMQMIEGRVETGEFESAAAGLCEILNVGADNHGNMRLVLNQPYAKVNPFDFMGHTLFAMGGNYDLKRFMPAIPLRMTPAFQRLTETCERFNSDSGDAIKEIASLVNPLDTVELAAVSCAFSKVAKIPKTFEYGYQFWNAIEAAGNFPVCPKGFKKGDYITNSSHAPENDWDWDRRELFICDGPSSLGQEETDCYWKHNLSRVKRDGSSGSSVHHYDARDWEPYVKTDISEWEWVKDRGWKRRDRKESDSPEVKAAPKPVFKKDPSFKATKFTEFKDASQTGAAYYVIHGFYWKSGRGKDVYTALNNVLMACISGGVSFGLSDFIAMQNELRLYAWMSTNEGQESWGAYGSAIRHCNESAILAYEAWRGRIPFKVGKKRVCTGSVFKSESGRTCKVTAIEDYKGADGFIRVKSYIEEWDKEAKKRLELDVQLHKFTELEWKQYTVGAVIEK